MNEYAIEVIRNGQSIMSFNLDADGIVEIIRALHTATGSGALESKAEPETPKLQKRGPKGKKVKGCSVCGKPGHNRITCPKRDGDEEPSDKRRFFMPRDKFDRVKLSVTHDIPADVIARELHVPLGEVNKAIMAKSYETYSA